MDLYMKSLEIQSLHIWNKNSLYAFRELYTAAGIESSSFGDAMRLPAWVNINEGARQSTP
jgi:hypothetical protein